MALRLLVALLLTLALAPVPACTEDFDWRRIERVDSLVLFASGSPVGRLTHLLSLDSQAARVEETTVLKSVNWMNPQANDSVEIIERRRYRLNGRLAEAEQTLISSAGQSHWRLEPGDDHWTLTAQAGGATTTRRLDRVPGTLIPLYRIYTGVLDGVIRAGDSWSDASLDLLSGEETISTTICLETPGAANGLWVFSTHNPRTQRKERWVLNSEGRTVEQEAPPLFVARIARDDDPLPDEDIRHDKLRDQFSVRPVMTSGDVPGLYLRFAGEMTLHESVAAFYEPNGQRFRLRPPPDRVNPELTVDSLAVPDSAWLSPTVTIQCDHPRIKRLAAQVAPEENRVASLVERLNQHVFVRIEKRNTATFSSALETLETGFGDCGEHAVLLAALLRARNIPARVVFGLVRPEGSPRYTYHAWTAVWIGRWVFADPAFGSFPAHQGLAPLVVDDSGSKMAELAGLMGRIEIQIVR